VTLSMDTIPLVGPSVRCHLPRSFHASGLDQVRILDTVRAGGAAITRPQLVGRVCRAGTKPFGPESRGLVQLLLSDRPDAATTSTPLRARVPMVRRPTTTPRDNLLLSTRPIVSTSS
jgi:hypothetical protein